MSILITGGAGFIGSHLCESFGARGLPVTVLDDLSSGTRSNFVLPMGDLVAEGCVNLVEGDVADAALVAKLVAEANVVYHLAAIASVPVCTAEPERATRTNVAGTQAVFDAVAAAQKVTGRQIPVIYASSAAVYGDNPNIPLSESETPAPINLYGEHKLENERIAARAFTQHGVRSVGLRFFNVYGPRQDPSSPYSGVISKFIDNARAEKPLTIFGDGEQFRDFIYVSDIVNTLLTSESYAKGSFGHDANASVFNVGTGTATNLKLLARTIGMALHARDPDLDFQPARAGDITRSLANPAAIMDAMQIGHWTALRSGLEQTLAAHA
ncbi:MAG: NAD-dependent epimerase/dehydratase family protein [Rickettsiales bacterium]